MVHGNALRTNAVALRRVATRARACAAINKSMAPIARAAAYLTNLICASGQFVASNRRALNLATRTINRTRRTQKLGRTSVTVDRRRPTAALADEQSEVRPGTERH
jgi:hypothetical protein